jgi:hypothetical protein
MNYRARTVGASLEIQPLHHSGTLVTCSLPIKDSGKSIRRAAGPPAADSVGDRESSSVPDGSRKR